MTLTLARADANWPVVASIVSAAASMVYAVISGVSLFLLSRQIRDARRFGAAPALYALLKEMDELMAVYRVARGRDAADPALRDAVEQLLDFYERVEHLRAAGMLPEDALRRAFGNALRAHLADPAFAAAIGDDARHHEEVMQLAERLR